MNRPARALLCEFCDRSWLDCPCRATLHDPVEAKRARRLVETRHQAAVALAAASDAARDRWLSESVLDALRPMEMTR
ncbi:MAG: hypothetical protein AB7W59_01880 [Acidimicrobiia bacterium]